MKTFKKVRDDRETVHQNGDDTLLNSDVLDTLQKEVKEAIAQANRGELMPIDEAFEHVLKAIEEK